MHGLDDVEVSDGDVVAPALLPRALTAGELVFSDGAAQVFQADGGTTYVENDRRTLGEWYVDDDGHFGSFWPPSYRASYDLQENEFFRDWDRVANDSVALLRAEAGRNPYDRGLSDLIGELSTRSDDFRVRWVAHNVRIHSTGVKLVHHPVVGDVDLWFESFPLAGDPSQSMVTFTAEPGSPSQDALTLLASWAATSGTAEHVPSTDDSVPAASIEKTD